VTGEVSAPAHPEQDVEEPRWLDAAEQDAWRRLVAVLRLPGELEAQLQRDAGMSHFEYRVLALLSESPGRSLRMSQLAAQANASLSRRSHVVTRLERRGSVTRRPCPDDARTTLVELSETGFDRLHAAAPGHVANVRRLVFDALPERDAEELGRLCDVILTQVDARG
jgi:DNA-binding MarR family transcriptional regulator